MSLAPGGAALASSASRQLPGWRNSTCAPPPISQHHWTVSIEEGPNIRRVAERLRSVHLPSVDERGPILHGSAELGDHTLPVSLYELLMIAPDVVYVYLVEAQVHVVLDVLQMLVKVGGHQDPVSEVVYVNQLRHRREVFRVADVGLGERHSAVGPLPYGLLLGLLLTLRPRDV